jgi:hypothetical protein
MSKAKTIYVYFADQAEAATPALLGIHDYADGS